jgi:Protein of unknown function (DUF3307)
MRNERHPAISLELALIISLLAHFVGDYLIQNQWMADTKTSRWLPALVHGFTYTIPFLLATHSLVALLVIALTHAVIDRYRLAKYLIWFKNQLVPKASRYPWDGEINDKTTGFPKRIPSWMSVWLLIIVDNVCHILINTLAIVFLGHLLVMF